MTTAGAAAEVREALVCRVGRERVHIRLLPSCSACSGCQGRCGLPGSPGLLTLPLQQFACRPTAGQRLRLSIRQPDLWSAARQGYGWPLLGLVGGALATQPLVWQWPHAADLITAGALLAGTFAGIALSKRRSSIAWRITPAP